jgi:Type IV secretory pathway, TrbF components
MKDKTAANNPHLAAKEEWSEAYGSYVAAANNWRIVALLSLLIGLVAVGAFVWKSNEQTITPYIVEVNQLGEVNRLFKADVASKPNAAMVRTALRNWIIGARTVYVDMRATADLINRTYSMTLPSSPAYTMLANYHRENDPYKRAADETVEVTVNAIVPISDESWQIEWNEIRRGRQGTILDEKQWQATVTIVLAVPKTEEQILANPIGLFVKQFAWTTRIK